MRDKVKQTKYMREYRRLNPDYIHRQKENCKRWRSKNREYGVVYAKNYRKINRIQLCENMRKRNKNLRLEIINRLGGQCACCGETNWQFLCLNHINGGGHKHRLSCNYSRTTIYNEVKKEGFPKDKYNILCWNCNAALGQFGCCPHQNHDVKIEDILKENEG